MGKQKDISKLQKAAISALIRTGEFSFREIARMEKVSHQTVVRINKNFNENSSITPKGRRNCKGSRKTTERKDRIIFRKAMENRFATLKSMQNDLNNEGIQISFCTLRRRLLEFNLRGRRPVKKPKLTKRMHSQRWEWAKTFKNQDLQYWEKVMFSDECRLEAVTESHKFVRRRPGERYSDDCITRNVKHPPSVMIWSCISMEGPGPLYFVNGTMDKNQFKST